MHVRDYVPVPTACGALCTCKASCDLLFDAIAVADPFKFADSRNDGCAGRVARDQTRPVKLDAWASATT